MSAVYCIRVQVEVAVVAVVKQEAVAGLASVKEAVGLAYRRLEDGRTSNNRGKWLIHSGSDVLRAAYFIRWDVDRIITEAYLARGTGSRGGARRAIRVVTVDRMPVVG
jgi:hypothetical protein